MSALETLIRDLHRRKGRERRGLALAEGVRLVEEALAARVSLQGAVVSPQLESTSRGIALLDALRAARVHLESVTDLELDKLADTESPQGVVAVFVPPASTLASITLEPGGVVLVLDAVQDPGNVGTMLRTAFALGAAGVVALPGTADLRNSKVIRGSMGALFRLPCVATDPDALIDWARARDAEVCIAEAPLTPPHAPSRPLTPRRAPSRPLLLVLGNEGAGVSDSLRAAGTRSIGIPLAPGAESLNVAVAAGILLHEVLRGN